MTKVLTKVIGATLEEIKKTNSDDKGNTMAVDDRLEIAGYFMSYNV